MIVILYLCNAKCLLRTFDDVPDKILRGRLLVLRSRQGFCKKEYINQDNCVDVQRKQRNLPRLVEEHNIRESVLGCRPLHNALRSETTVDFSHSHHSSISSSVSTRSSVEDFLVPKYDEPSSTQHFNDVANEKIQQSTPQSYAQWFPSSETLFVRHGDEAVDGNMCLSVVTATDQGIGPLLQLFYLRMHDLKNREFSLLRYGRDSGREVCHTHQIYKKAPGARSRFRRSISGSVNNIRSFSRRSSRSSQMSAQSSQSGNESANYYSESALGEGSEVEAHTNVSSPQPANDDGSPKPSNKIRLEFANYAHVTVSRKGIGARKSYDFQYWGTKYQWKRLNKSQSSGRKRSYNLYRGLSDLVVAHIAMQDLNPAHSRDRETSGAWVPPIWMRITDPSILSSENSTDIPE